MITDSNERYYSPATLAEHWAMSETRIRQLYRSGDLRFVKVGRLVRIPSDAVREYELKYFRKGGMD